jgi:hypothetical protein
MGSYKIWELEIETVRNDTDSVNISLTDVNDIDVPASTFSSAKCQIRKSRNKDAIFTFDTADSSMLLTDGNIELVFTANNAKPGIYYGDIEFILASNSKKVTPISITWNIEDDYTI